MSPVIPPSVADDARLAALARYAVLDTLPEAAFDDITRLAAAICQAPVALVSLVDRDRQWFKAEVGLGFRQTPVGLSICAHALDAGGLYVVPDATRDPAFADNPLVTGEPHLRFYAGAPLVTPDGYPLGTLCVLDRRPRELTDAQAAALRTLAAQVVALLELRRAMAAQAALAEAERDRAEAARGRDDADAVRQRQQMELVVRGANVGVWYCPLPFDRLIWDETVKAHFHLPADADVTIETFYARIHPDDRASTRAAIEASIAGRASYDIDYRTVAPDGRETKWVRAMGRGFYGPGGEPVRFDGITIDVTARKLAELALRESEERYRLATRATDNAVWDWDLRTDEIRWNEAVIHLFGYQPDQVEPTGAWWVAHVHPEDRARVTAGIHAVIDDPARDQWQDEYRFVVAGGGTADVFDRGYVLRDAAGRGLRMLGAMQDLTARRRVERQREQVLAAERAARAEAQAAAAEAARSARMKDEFLATLSHELRTPLNAILGWAQVVRRHPGEPEVVAEGLATIERNARAQAQIVGDLLDMSRIVSGKVRMDVRRTDLAAVVRAAVDTCRPAADAKGIRLQVVLNPDASVVAGDPDRLQQVFWNLVSNAVKFTPKDGQVQVVLGRVDSRLEVAVADTGQGIDAAFLPHVFDRFRQADASTTRRHGGLGLGLAIVKQLVELHGGTVTARSPGLGQGATFTVVLPGPTVDPGSDGAAAPGRPPRAGDRPAALADPLAALDPSALIAGVRVLVVDDESDARELVRVLLAECGAVVTTAGSAAEALDRFAADRPDVLVSDIGMPGEDGYALIRRVRALGPDHGGRVPALALTAYARSEDRVRAVLAGFQSHVAKPVEPSELITMIASLAGRTGSTPAGAGTP
ncbi:MAG: sensor hybrid histidine kinase [Phycisphaerales bacterium]|nr:sensor hybrid histidine kinase [Phycisphaerales bacterium]